METKSNIKFYPYVNVNYVKIENKILGLENSLSKLNEIHSTTILISDFSNDVNAKYFPSSEELDGTSFSVYRKTYYQTYYDYLCTLTDNRIFFKDYNIVNNEYYHYLTSAEIVSGNKIEYLTFENKDKEDNDAYINTNWNSFSICDIIETDDEKIYKKVGDVWLFKGNLSEGDVSLNLNVTMNDTLGKYSKAYVGEKKYDSGKISCLLGNVENYYVLKDDSVKTKYGYNEKKNYRNYYEKETKKLETWKDFCANGNLKLLKNISGDSWIVQIIDNPSRSVVLSCDSPVTSISFSWQEVLDKNEFSIIEDL